jgi:hypothetical protein
MKQVMVIAHSFDCLAGHVSITGRGEGTSVRIALGRAVDAVFDDLRLKHKRISSCRLTVTVAQGNDDAK